MLQSPSRAHDARISHRLTARCTAAAPAQLAARCHRRDPYALEFSPRLRACGHETARSIRLPAGRCARLFVLCRFDSRSVAGTVTAVLTSVLASSSVTARRRLDGRAAATLDVAAVATSTLAAAAVAAATVTATTVNAAALATAAVNASALASALAATVLGGSD